jgi:hypothetical protein
MKEEEKEQEKPEEKQKSSSDSKEELFQRLRDHGIKVTDETKEWEGKTTLILTSRPPRKAEENE